MPVSFVSVPETPSLLSTEKEQHDKQILQLKRKLAEKTRMANYWKKKNLEESQEAEKQQERRASELAKKVVKQSKRKKKVCC